MRLYQTTNNPERTCRRAPVAKVKCKRTHSNAKDAGKLHPKLDLRTRCGKTKFTKINRAVFVSTAADLDVHHSIAKRAQYAGMKLARARIVQKRLYH